MKPASTTRSGLVLVNDRSPVRCRMPRGCRKPLWSTTSVAMPWLAANARPPALALLLTTAAMRAPHFPGHRGERWPPCWSPSGNQDDDVLHTASSVPGTYNSILPVQSFTARKWPTSSAFSPASPPRARLGNYAGPFAGDRPPAAKPAWRAFLPGRLPRADQCDDPAHRRSRLEIAATWLAAGLDTQRVTFYRQSDIPEPGTELAADLRDRQGAR